MQEEISKFPKFFGKGEKMLPAANAVGSIPIAVYQIALAMVSAAEVALMMLAGATQSPSR